MSSIHTKLGAWFLKDSGKSFVFGCAVAAVAGVGCIQIFPNTFLLNQYRDVVRLHKDGLSVPVTQPLLERFKKTLDLLEISEIDKKQFKPFMVIGFDIFSAGTSFSHFGVAIGLPINYTYIDVDVIDTSKIRVNDEAVPWEVDEGKLLLKAFRVSEKAQIYAMAREIELRKTLKYLMDTITPVCFAVAAYGLGHNLNIKLDLFNKLRAVRFTLYGIIGVFMYGNYAFLKDFSQLYYEKKVDNYLKNKNPIFREGGKDFYDSILKRNIALRYLMGKAGESKYTPLGNENYSFRQRHLPLIQRKAFFEQDVEYNM